MNITIKILDLTCSYFWASASKLAKIIIINLNIDSNEEHSSSNSEVDELIKLKKSAKYTLRQFPWILTPFTFILNQGSNDLLMKTEILKQEAISDRGHEDSGNIQDIRNCKRSPLMRF